MSVLIYESYGDLTGTASTLSDVIGVLRRFTRQSLLWHCAAINYGARTWESNRFGPKGLNRSISDAIGTYYPHSLAARLKRGYFYSEQRVVFHRRQLLALQKLALVNGRDNGIDVGSEPYTFGRLLLMINDHLHSPAFKPPETLSTPLEFAAFVQELLPVSEIGDENFGASLKRSVLMLGPLTQARSGKKSYFDAMAFFEERLGVGKDTYSAFLFAAAGYLNSLTFRQVLKARGEVYLNHHRFVTTRLSVAEITKIFLVLSESADWFREDVARRDHGVNDFTALRRRPLASQWLNIGSWTQWCGYLALDPIYLWDKLLTGPYWMASDFYQSSFRSFWGEIFEDYCNEVMTQATDGSKSIYIPDVRCEAGQVCDALLLEGDKLILLEFKGFMLSAEAKYGGDAAVLLKGLEDNLVRGSKGKRKKKAMEQIADALETLFGKRAFIREVLPQWREIREVYPCIVTLDLIGGAIAISPFLELYARKQELPVRKLPTFCLPVSELERKAPYFASNGFSNILLQWITQNPSLGTPLGQLEIELKERRELPILDSRAILESNAESLFPEVSFSE